MSAQLALDWNPPAASRVRAARPPHAPERQPALQDAALKILALLADGLPHDRHELETLAGNRYAARLGEVREACALDGAVILGPRPQPSRGISETEPPGPGGVERYRMVRW